MERREFIAGALGAVCLLTIGGTSSAFGQSNDLLRPPGGTDESRLIGACLKCDRCRSVCPQNCIVTATVEKGILNARTPTLDFTKGYCDFCKKCIEVCPTSALEDFSTDCDFIGIAQLDSQSCVSCKACVPACQWDALSWDENEGLPVVDEELCNGCGACEYSCPSSSYGYYSSAKKRAIYVTKRK